MFLQIHYLTSYHASLLNRDDTGLAKRIPFGGFQRLRISSQCQKRHWRDFLVNKTDLPTAIRSRHFFGRQIKERLVHEGMDEKLAHDLVFELAKAVLTSAGNKDALEKDTLEMKQPVLFGRPEADYFVKLIKEAAQEDDEKKAIKKLKDTIKDHKKNFKALMVQAGVIQPHVGLEGALFGRFVTSDVLARVDAPVHVAHAFTTHILDTEVDYFSVVDDLGLDEETGASHIGDMELGAGVFYGYVAVDVPLLVSNLTGADPKDWKKQDDSSARAVLESLIDAISLVTPGAKLGATAPYSRAEFILMETGSSQPRSLANAFLKPVEPSKKESLLQSSVKALADYLSSLESMYGGTEGKRFLSTIHDWPRYKEKPAPLTKSKENAINEIFGEQS